MTIYSVSIIAVFTLLALMYVHAYRRRAALGLDEAEIVITRASIQSHAIWIAIGLFAIVLSNVGGPGWVPIAGFSYALLAPAQAANGLILGRRAERIRQAEIGTRD